MSVVVMTREAEKWEWVKKKLALYSLVARVLLNHDVFIPFKPHPPWRSNMIKPVDAGVLAELPRGAEHPAAKPHENRDVFDSIL